MKELIVNAIAAGARDYKESDKLVKLITAEHGVINAVMKGVKKEKAKLKFAAMPFSFCEYSLTERGGFYTVKTAVPLESLFEVSYDPDNYLTASLMLETAAHAMGAESAPNIFLYLLKSIKALLYSGVDGYSVALNFICKILVWGGHYALSGTDADYSCDVEIQTSLERGAALIKLKKLARLFQDKYGCTLNSAILL